MTRPPPPPPPTKKKVTKYRLTSCGFTGYCVILDNDLCRNVQLGLKYILYQLEILIGMICLFFHIAGSHDVQELDDSDKKEVRIAMAESALTTVLSLSIVYLHAS